MKASILFDYCVTCDLFSLVVKKCTGIPSCFYANFLTGNSFCDFLFGFPDNEALANRSLLSKEIVCALGDNFVLLTHSHLGTHKGSKANSAEPDQTPHTVASDQGLHCLLTGFSIRME